MVTAPKVAMLQIEEVIKMDFAERGES